MEKAGIIITEAVVLFEYGKANEGYWDGSKLHQQVVNKALPITEALYPGYSLLFLFDNATSHSVYAQNALRTTQMNKGVGGKQPWLCDGWFERDGVRITQPMSFQKADGILVQKRVQQVLEERNLWPRKGFNLECLKPKCFNCELAICEKGHRCDSCKTPYEHSSICTKARKCDTCVQRATICQCVTKKYCATCSLKKRKCMDCKEFSPKCTTASKLRFFQVL